MVDIGITGGFLGARETGQDFALREFNLAVQGGLQAPEALAGINPNNAGNARGEEANRANNIRRHVRTIEDIIDIRTDEITETLIAEGEEERLRNTQEQVAARQARAEFVAERSDARVARVDAAAEAAAAINAAQGERIEAEAVAVVQRGEPIEAGEAFHADVAEEEARQVIEEEVQARIPRAIENNADLLEIAPTRLTVEDEIALREVGREEAAAAEAPPPTADAEARQAVQNEIVTRAQAEQAAAAAAEVAEEARRAAEAPAAENAGPNAAEITEENERLTGVGNTVDIFV